MIELKNLLRTANLNVVLTSVKNFVNSSISALADAVSDVMEEVNSSITSLETGKEDAIKNATAKTTIVDADTIPLSDSAASAGTKKITFANLKIALRNAFDGRYTAYGTCSTAANVAAKVVTVNSNWTLAAGNIICVKFTTTNTAQNPTLNVNNTGAKSVRYNTAVITTSTLNIAGYADRPILYMYDGTDYVFLGWAYDTNTTYSNASLGQGYATCATAETTVAKAATLSSYSLTTGGVVAVKFTYAVPASATLNVNSKGAKPIYHKGAAIKADIIKAGDIATFIYNGSQYHLLAIDAEIGVAGGSGGGDLEACEVTFATDGSITETFADRTVMTVFNADGSITETQTKGGKTTVRTTVFNDDGSISQTLS